MDEQLVSQVLYGSFRVNQSSPVVEFPKMDAATPDPLLGWTFGALSNCTLQETVEGPKKFLEACLNCKNPLVIARAILAVLLENPVTADIWMATLMKPFGRTEKDRENKPDITDFIHALPVALMFAAVWRDNYFKQRAKFEKDLPDAIIIIMMKHFRAYPTNSSEIRPEKNIRELLSSAIEEWISKAFFFAGRQGDTHRQKDIQKIITAIYSERYPLENLGGEPNEIGYDLATIMTYGVFKRMNLLDKAVAITRLMRTKNAFIQRIFEHEQLL
ncbi:MAG: hypothetical protein WCV50_04460 [Patescibacteria group bacterium]|jgi:hypothetical protein